MLDAPQLEKVIEDVLRGRSDRFIEIVRAYGPDLRVFLGTRLFHLDEVDDLAQETFIVAYRRLNTFRRGEDFGAWLRGIARNKLRRYFEQHGKRSRERDVFREQVAALLEESLEARARDAYPERLQIMLNCIRKLPERVRHVIRSQMDGHKAATLAEEMETSVGAIYQLQYRGLQLLRECVKKEEPYGR